MSKIKLSEVIPMLHEISECIDEEIYDEDKISDIIELMRDIVEDNYMYIRH